MAISASYVQPANAEPTFFCCSATNPTARRSDIGKFPLDELIQPRQAQVSHPRLRGISNCGPFTEFRRCVRRRCGEEIITKPFCCQDWECRNLGPFCGRYRSACRNADQIVAINLLIRFCNCVTPLSRTKLSHHWMFLSSEPPRVRFKVTNSKPEAALSR